MTLDTAIFSLIYLACAYTLFWLGKIVFDLIHREFRVNEELLQKNNAALAVSLAGYYFGLILVIGGALVGPSVGLADDLIDIFLYGLLAIALLNISTVINNRLILYQFDNTTEIIRDQNVGTGVVVSATYIATGLILFGAISGEGGTIWTALAFWGLGQLALVIVSLLYERITPYSIHEHIERDNTAVGVAFAGALIGMGNILRYAVSGDFESWNANLTTFGLYAGIGLIALPLIRVATDKILLPGASMAAELVEQERPNLGAAYIIMFSYIGSSFIIGWCL
jgi:uncharacterized membrane protein YjfL (UPF0719 family)|tara:strand:+ start:753 stop:1598 length:846 start_codon:yes stop_codon:yes gene_type:complete